MFQWLTTMTVSPHKNPSFWTSNNKHQLSPWHEFTIHQIITLIHHYCHKSTPTENSFARNIVRAFEQKLTPVVAITGDCCNNLLAKASNFMYFHHQILLHKFISTIHKSTVKHWNVDISQWRPFSTAWWWHELFNN